LFFLGIDPGYGRVGYGIIEETKKLKRSIEYGVIETPTELPFEDRLVLIRTAMASILLEYRIQGCGVERLFFRKNLTTGVNVLQARGVILYSLAKENIPIFEFTPTTVKKLVTGNGKANKVEVQNMVAKMLKIQVKIKPDDAADALAISIAASIQSKTRMKS